jgi:hypothetical protein
MTNQAYPALNDIVPSWADIQTTFTISGGDALDMVDIAAVKWGRKSELGEQRGASGGRVMARTSGSGSQEASATLYRSGYRKLLKSLMAKAPTRGNQALISYVSFDILIQHTVPNDPEIYTTHIKGCRFLGESDDMKEGNEADKIEINLNPIEVANVINGKEVVLL